MKEIPSSAAKAKNGRYHPGRRAGSLR